MMEMKKIFLYSKFVLKKKNFKYVENITFNESISCGDIGFHFRKKFKNHGFFIGSVSEILPRKKLNTRVFYYDGESKDLSLKSIQTYHVFILYHFLIQFKNLKLLLEKFPWWITKSNFYLRMYRVCEVIHIL